jgi:hypothetical protein
MWHLGRRDAEIAPPFLCHVSVGKYEGPGNRTSTPWAGFGHAPRPPFRPEVGSGNDLGKKTTELIGESGRECDNLEPT